MPALIDSFLPLSCELAPQARTAGGQIRIVPLGPDRAAVYYPVPAAFSRAGPLAVRLGQGALVGPFAATTLELAAGRRQVVLLGIGAERLLREGLTLAQDGQTIARLTPEMLQSPLASPLALIAGLSQPGAARLLRLLLTTGVSLFGAGAHPDFHALAEHLLAILPVTDLALVSVRAVGRRGCLLSCRGPDGPGQPAAIVLLEGTRVQAQRSARVLAGSGAGRLDLFLPKLPAPGATLLVLGPHPLRLAIPPDRPRPLGLAGWFRRAAPPLQAEVLALVDGLSPEDTVARAQAAEVRCPREALPQLTLKAAALTESGLIYALAVRDPQGLLSAVRIGFGAAGPSVVFRLKAPVLHPDWGPVHLGHVALGPAPAGSVPALRGSPRLDAVTASGRIVPQGRVAIPLFDGTLPEGLKRFRAEAAVEATAAALIDFFAHRSALRVAFHDFGEPPDTPRLRILVPFDGFPDLLCAAVTALAVESRPAGIEAIVLPAQASRAERLGPLLEDLHAVTGIALRLALPDRPCHEAELLRAVLAKSDAAETILLPAGAVLPAKPGWLARWRRRLAASASPRLLTALPGAAPAGGVRPATGGTPVWVGFNRAAAASLIASPLRTASRQGDLACLATILGPGSVAVERRSGIGVLAGRPGQDPSLEAAEARIAESLRRRPESGAP